MGIAKITRTYLSTMPSSDEVNVPSLYFDAVTSISPSFTARQSKYVLSDKSEITNHRVLDNPSVQIVGWVGRSPLDNFENSMVSNRDRQRRPTATKDILMSWYKSGATIYVVNEYHNYSGYYINSLSWKGEGDSLEFSATLEKARRVGYSRGILVQHVTATIEKDAKGTGNAGGGAKKAADEEEKWMVEHWADFYAKGYKDLGSINSGDEASDSK